jgi:hypothetical protein
VKKAANDRIKHVLFQLAIERQFKSRLGTSITKFSEIGEDFEQDPLNRENAERLWELYFGSFDRCSGVWQKELENELLEKFSLEYEVEEKSKEDQPVDEDNSNTNKVGRRAKHTFLMKIISNQRGQILRAKKARHEHRSGYYLVKSIDIVENYDSDGKCKTSGRKLSVSRPLRFHDEYLVGNKKTKENVDDTEENDKTDQLLDE